MAAHPANVPSRGEINQTGDMVRAALILGEQGEAKYCELAERCLRGSLLPAQLWESDLRGFLRDNPNPKNDAERNVIERSVGGYGFPLPNARMREGDWPIFTLDITSGAVYALCEAWRHRVMSTDKLRVNLLFDYDGAELAVKSALPQTGRLELTPRSKKPVLLRVPDWVDASTLALKIGGKTRKPIIAGGYLKVTARAGEKAVVTFAVPKRETDETVDGITYQVTEIAPRGKVSPMF